MPLLSTFLSVSQSYIERLWALRSESFLLEQHFACAQVARVAYSERRSLNARTSAVAATKFHSRKKNYIFSTFIK